MYYYSTEICLFPNDRKGLDSDAKKGGEELGGFEGFETKISLYCVREKIFQ